MINETWCKITVWFSYIFNIFSDIPLDFLESIQVVSLNRYLASIDTQ